MLIKMVRIRRLQRQDETWHWYDDSYAIESTDGKIHFRYNLAWDVIGSRYYGKIQQSGLPLDQVHLVLDEPGLKWQPIETLDMTFDQATEILDPEFHIPRLKKRIPVPVA